MNMRARAMAALKHLGLSALVAALVAGLVFGVWYPAPYGVLAGGIALFTLIVSVDVISGPLLTFAVFNTKKPRTELRRDIGIIVALQVLALGYGLYSVLEARPIFLAYEGDRFRVVSKADIDPAELVNAAPEFQQLSYAGPRLVAAKLVDSSDPEFHESLFKSLEGVHPSFRPERWVPLASLRNNLLEALHPMDTLIKKHPEAAEQIQLALENHALTAESAGYLPMDAEKADPVSWSVVVDRATGEPKAFLPLDGW